MSSPLASRGRYARLLFVVPEMDERQRTDRRVGAERPAERRVDGDLLADIRRADQIESKPAVLGRDFEAQQIELARLAQQLPRQVPVVLVELLDDRQHFLLHELGGRLAEQTLLVGQFLACENVVGIDGGCQELPARDRVLCVSHIVFSLET